MERIEIDSDCVTLKVHADFADMRDAADCFYLDGGVWKSIGISQKMYFKLDQFTGCRFGLFLFSTKQTGGYADFMDLHNHDGHEILLVLGGAINFYTEFGGIRLERGDLICIHELEFHRGALLTREQYDRIVINVKSSVLRSVSSEQTDLETCFQRSTNNSLNVLSLAVSFPLTIIVSLMLNLR